jgi:hypothetical protein
MGLNFDYFVSPMCAGFLSSQFFFSHIIIRFEDLCCYLLIYPQKLIILNLRRIEKVMQV